MRAKKRGGFTLVEMLVVIAILSVLAGLIIPALMNARTSARAASAAIELKQIESAMSAFQAKFGVQPPSFVTLYERGTLTAGGQQTWSTDPASVATITRLWPNFDFTMDRDLNGDGAISGAYTLNSAEALAFWLGGRFIADSSSGATKYMCVGFSANPADPFSSPTANKNRIGPFFEFDSSRLQDRNTNGFLEYRGSLSDVNTDPIVYCSIADGSGTLDAGKYAPPSGAKFSPYRQNPPAAANAVDAPQYFKPQGFQLVAPGFDGLLGSGGYYDPQNPATSLSTRKNELDNITNFVGGQLAGGAK